jgi:hypothetical protein
MPEEKLNENVKIADQFSRAESFLTRYANNINYETSVFDLKIVFGELVQPIGKTPYVEQHTAMTLSWLEAKIAAVFLSMNVAIHEKRFGTLNIPNGTMPADFRRTSEELQLPLMKLMELVAVRPPVEPRGSVAETDKIKVTQ